MKDAEHGWFDGRFFTWANLKMFFRPDFLDPSRYFCFQNVVQKFQVFLIKKQKADPTRTAQGFVEVALQREAPLAP